MVSVDEKLTKVGDDRRSATVFLKTDVAKDAEARDDLSCMDASRKAVAIASDLGVPDPRIVSGPTIVPVDGNGDPLTDFGATEFQLRSQYDIAARIV